MSIYLSELDYQRFGYKTAQARLNSADEQSQLRQFSQENAVELAIVRVPASELSLLQSLEDEGYRMMDCLLYYAYKFDKKATPTDERHQQIRMLVPEDIETVLAIAEESFRGYFGHYHADSRLPKEKCDEVYVDWVKNSLMKEELQHYVIGLEDSGQLNSFLSYKVNSPEEVEVMLSGILHKAQGQGIHQALMSYAAKWAFEQRAKRCIVSTQVTNASSQKAWTRIGFEVDKAYYTLHKWF